MQTLMSLMMASMMVARFTRLRGIGGSAFARFSTRTPAIVDVEAAHIAHGLRFDGDIAFQNVAFRYGVGDDDLVLDDVSFRVRSGETVAILGATGAGKSSFVNLIRRVLADPESGSVKIDGVDISVDFRDDLRSTGYRDRSLSGDDPFRRDYRG